MTHTSINTGRRVTSKTRTQTTFGKKRKRSH